MRTFIQWLVENNLWNQYHLAAMGRRRPTLGPDYEHFMCDNCGASYPREWIEEMGMACRCGGKLTQVSADELEQGHEKLKAHMFNTKAKATR
jgi:hypothetical protein